MTDFNNMVPALGIVTIESGDGRAVGEMEHRPDLSQATGVFHTLAFAGRSRFKRIPDHVEAAAH